MTYTNKRNLVYFENASMHGLFNDMELWQVENEKRLLSVSIQKDCERFCCIALTNPTEVVVTSWSGRNYAEVSEGALVVFNIGQ